MTTFRSVCNVSFWVVLLSLVAGVQPGMAQGTVSAWGRGLPYGGLGNGTYDDSNVPVAVSNLTGVSAIAGGLFHSLALTTGGSVWAWGPNGEGELGNGTNTDGTTPVPVSNLAGVVAISGGAFH